MAATDTMGTKGSAKGKGKGKGDMGSKSDGAPTIVRAPALAKYMRDVSLRLTDDQERHYKDIAGKEWAVMAGSSEEAQFLAWLCRLIGARTVVEVGVFRGSTTLAICDALPPGGIVYGHDITDEYLSDEMRQLLSRGGRGTLDLRVGPATETLEALLREGKEGTIDLAFIDADKEGYDSYYERCLRLVRVGGIIAIDNVFFQGTVLRPDEYPAGAAMDKLNRKIHRDNRVELSMLPVADGLTLCRKVAEVSARL